MPGIWHRGRRGFTYHPEHVQSTMTREQYLARWDEERRARAAQGYKWDLLYGTYAFVGPGSPSTPASAMTREQFLASEAEQHGQMRAKGMKWNQLFGAYQR